MLLILFRFSREIDFRTKLSIQLNRFLARGFTAKSMFHSQIEIFRLFIDKNFTPEQQEVWKVSHFLYSWINNESKNLHYFRKKRGAIGKKFNAQWDDILKKTSGTLLSLIFVWYWYLWIFFSKRFSWRSISLAWFFRHSCHLQCGRLLRENQQHYLFDMTSTISPLSLVSLQAF